MAANPELKIVAPGPGRRRAGQCGVGEDGRWAAIARGTAGPRAGACGRPWA